MKSLLKIRTFDEIQRELSSRNTEQNRNPLLIDHGSSRLHPQASCLDEPLNLNKNLNTALNEFSSIGKTNLDLTSERKLVMDVLQLVSQPAIDSDTFMRDDTQLKVLFRLRHRQEGFGMGTALSHLS